MLKLKPGVRAHGLDVEGLLGIVVASSVYEALGYDCTVTSITDGRHGVDSHHHIGWAFDLRSRDIPPSVRPHLVANLKSALPGYDVVVESTHIHVEYDPK